MATDMSTGKHWCPDCDGGAYCPRSGQLPEPDVYSTKPLLDKSIQPDTTSIICGHCGRRYRLADGHSCKERYQPRTPQIAALDKDKEIE